MASKKKAPKTPRQIWIEEFLADDCCGNGHQSGYDAMTFSCRHTDHETVTENALYNICDTCSNGDILCSKCVTEAVADAVAEAPSYYTA